MRRRSVLFLGVVVVLLSSVELFAQCGVERWSIKTGTDSQASSINLSTYISSTIYNFQQSVAPSPIPSTRVAPRETNQYSVSGTLTKYVRESDSDYHLVLVDSAGRTMIIEIPSPNCVGGGSPFGTKISHARSQFDARLTATTTMKSTSIPITIKGIGFWDFKHGQTGVAPNGIEVHPVLDIVFNSAKTGDEDIYVPAAELPKDIVLDNDGGRVHLFRGGDPIANVLFHGGGVIEEPRIEVIFAGDTWDEASRNAVLNVARGLSSDARFADLGRYGVRTNGLAVDARQLRGDPKPMHLLSGSTQIAGQREMNDLDVQRALANAIEEGRIQQRDEDVLYIVMLDRNTSAAVGETRDWQSYHSQFHATELATSYVVVRGDLDAASMREAMFASVARAIINPAGNGWF
jgi:hypothetical protein